MEIEAGQIYEVTYPFIEEEVKSIFDQSTKKEWRPGVRNKHVYGGNFEPFADGEGKMILTVVDTFKPKGKYHKRVFYTRKWICPEGSSFGNNRLKIATLAFFRRRVSGYAFD